MDLKILVPRNVIYGNCPKCNDEMTLERVKSSNKAEKFLLMIFRFKKYHCKSCKWYGTLFIYRFPRKIFRVLLNYLIILLIIASISILISLFVKFVLKP